jgi:cephalosporin hydroxylase
MCAAREYCSMSQPVGTAGLFGSLAQRSTKVSSYFAVYDRLLQAYRERDGLIMIEIGVADGGSLIVWSEFFGPNARIIGIDLDPAAAAMREKGFEIFIGDQSAPNSGNISLPK